MYHRTVALQFRRCAQQFSSPAFTSRSPARRPSRRPPRRFRFPRASRFVPPVGWEMVKAHPWLGLGPEEIAAQFDRYIPRPLPRGWYGHLHNIYLQYAAERGIFALAAILWLIARQARDFLGSLRRASDPTCDLRRRIRRTQPRRQRGAHQVPLRGRLRLRPYPRAAPRPRAGNRYSSTAPNRALHAPSLCSCPGASS